MASKEVEQAIKLGYSYNDEVTEALNANLEGNEQLAYELIRSLDLALKQFKKADDLEPGISLEDGKNTITGKAFAFGLKGVVQNMGLGKRAEAVKNLERSLEITDDIASVHQSLGWIYADSGNKEKGLFHLKKAVELDPDDIESRKTLDRLENVSQAALKYSSFRGSKKALLIWGGLTFLALIGIFSGWDGSIVSFIVFGLITFLYWKAKTKR
jgi:tetratricopeptide (TPR) repeat protein